jgi:hypothetical protein
MEECLESHRGRAARLAIEVSRRGGTPSAGSGLWGFIVGLSAALLATVGFRLAVRALEIVEGRGIGRYDKSWGLLDSPARHLLTTYLFPQQVLSHQNMVLLNDSVGTFVGTPSS